MTVATGRESLLIATILIKLYSMFNVN